MTELSLMGWMWVYILAIATFLILFNIISSDKPKELKKDMLGTAFYFLGIIWVVTILIGVSYPSPESSITESPLKIPYSSATVKATYRDNTADTFKIEVYEGNSNIYLENGDLQYQKIIKQSNTGVIAGRTILASYVKSFDIIQSNNQILLR